MLRSSLIFVTLAVAGVVMGIAIAAQSPRAMPHLRGAATYLLLGSQANAWSASAVGINGKSTAIDTQWSQICTAFGNTSGAATLTVEYSADNTNWYSSAINTGAVTGNFGVTFTTGARYVRLSSSAAVTITATLQCKSS